MTPAGSVDSGLCRATYTCRSCPTTLVRDPLPDLRATKGWVQEKVEGLTVGGDGRGYLVTDNDGVEDATGETVFLDLGSTRRVFGR